MSGWTCPGCGSTEFVLVTYERVAWRVKDGKQEIEELDGGTNLVGYRDEWECGNCDWRSDEAPPYEEEEK